MLNLKYLKSIKVDAEQPFEYKRLQLNKVSELKIAIWEMCNVWP